MTHQFCLFLSSTFYDMEKEREESRLKLREMYRGKYLDALKSESHQKYMEMLEKLSETN